MSASLPNFLAEAKKTLHQAIEKKEKVTLVIGNESADLDSIVSAILFAFHRSANPPSKAFTKQYIPIAQLSRSEVSSNAHLSALLSECNLQAEQFITLDDILKNGGTRSGLIADNTRIFLVNQNKLVGRMGENYSKNIIGCIDNHEEENYVPKEAGDEPRIVGKAATTTSLVVNHARSSSKSFGDWDPQLAKLGLGAILVDTEDMQGSSKITEEDHTAVEYLLQSITKGEMFDRARFYSTITGKQTAAVGGAEETREPSGQYRPQPIQPEGMVIGATGIGSTTGSSYGRGEKLPIIFGQNFRSFPLSGGAVGISTVHQSIKELIYQSEHDIAERSVQAATTSGVGTTGANPGTAQGHTEGGAGSTEHTGGTIGDTTGKEILPGSPFTAACREFARANGADIYGIFTNSTIGRELFIWALSPKLAPVMPRFLGNYSDPLGLSVWEGQDDEIVKEAGMYDGLMKVYWVGTSEATAEIIAGMIGESVGHA